MPKPKPEPKKKEKFRRLKKVVWFMRKHDIKIATAGMLAVIATLALAPRKIWRPFKAKAEGHGQAEPGKKAKPKPKPKKAPKKKEKKTPAMPSYLLEDNLVKKFPDLSREIWQWIASVPGKKLKDIAEFHEYFNGPPFMNAPPKFKKNLDKIAWDNMYERGRSTGRGLEAGEISPLVDRLSLVYGLREHFLKRMTYKEIVTGLKNYKKPGGTGLGQERDRLIINVVEEHLKKRGKTGKKGKRKKKSK